MKTIITINLVFTLVLSLITSAEAVTPTVYCKQINDASATKTSCEILDVQLSALDASQSRFLVKYCKNGVLKYEQTNDLNIVVASQVIYNPPSDPRNPRVPLNSTNCQLLP